MPRKSSAAKRRTIVLVATRKGAWLFHGDAARKTWKVMIKGMDVVEGYGFDPAQPTFHDPHCLRMCPGNPDRIYQQNHCCIYRIDRPSDTWVRIGKSMPKKTGDIGFPVVVHPRDGGKTWQRMNAGMPDNQAWWTVKRQAMTTDTAATVGIYFGTTSGELWLSRNEGQRWACIARHLPEIYAVETATLQALR